MTFTKARNEYVIRIFRDEDVFEEMTNFCEQEHINAAVFHGLGAVSEAEFGYYDLSQKKYFFKNYETMMEVVSLTGNVALFDDKPILHIHAVFSNTDNQTLGGHVKSMTVGVTLEIHLTEYNTMLKRKYDEEIGLNLLCLENG